MGLLVALFGLVGTPVTLVVATSSPAGALQVITVTTNADGVSPGPVGSLRHAFFDAGNTAPFNADDVEIDIPASVGTITLTNGEVLYNGGTGGTHLLTLKGGGNTIQQTTVGARVIHDSSSGLLTVNGVTVTGGNIDSAAGAGVLADAASVTVTNSTITGNTATGSGDPNPADGGGIFSSISVVVTDSTISNNTAQGNGGGGGISSPGPVMVTNSTITGNHATAGDGGGGISSDDQVTVIASSVTNNISDVEGGGIEAQGSVTVKGSTIAKNQAAEDAGGLDTEGTMTVSDSTINGNSAVGDGGGAETCGATSFTNSTITNNTAGGQGGGININGGCGASLGLVYVTITANTAQGDPGTLAAALRDKDKNRDKETTTSIRPLSAAGTANISLQGQPLTSFGSVVTHAPGDTGPNCTTGTTTSNGFNFSDDTLCGFTASTDKQNAGDPKLGALANNGGSTQTRKPQPGSPLIDAIPLASCQADGASGVTTDQRSLLRPSGPACDIGAVEIQIAPIVITPKFTG